MNSFISISNEQNLFEIDEEEFSQNCKTILDFALQNVNYSKETVRFFEANSQNDNNKINFDVVLCDNEMIKEINCEYRGKNKPTDVITFSLFADDENKMVIDNTINLGEIIISTQQISIQAIENKKAFNEELLFILVHGVLHLLGLDHPDDKSLQSMIELQEKIVKEILNDKIQS